MKFSKLFCKKNIVYFVELLLLFCLLPGMFRRNEVIYSADLQSMETISESEIEVILQSEEIELIRGVYEISAEFMPVSEAGTRIYLSAPEHTFYGFLSSGAVVDDGREAAGFRAYVSDKNVSARLNVAVPTGAGEYIDSISIVKTNLGSRLLVTCYLCIVLIVDLLILVHRKIVSGSMSKDSQIALWAIVGSIIFTLTPEYTDYITLNANSQAFIDKFMSLQDGFKLMNPLLYVSAGAYALGFPALYAYKACVVLVNVLSAVIVYFLLRLISKDVKCSAFGTAVFMFSPWRVGVLYFHQSLISFDKLSLIKLSLAFVLAVIGTFAMREFVKRFKDRKVLCYIVCGLFIAVTLLVGLYRIDAIALSRDAMWIY